MASEILAPTTAAGNSTDVTIAAGSTNTVALFSSDDDNLKLSAIGTLHGDLLLVDGVSVLLLAVQIGDAIPHDVFCKINLKDPSGGYRHSGLTLKGSNPFETLGPGIWQVEKPETSVKIGVQSE